MIDDRSRAFFRRQTSLRRFAALCLGAGSLASCAVGPDFETPAAPNATRFTREATASPGNGQSFSHGAEVSPHWWEAAARRFFEQTRAQREYGGVSQISVMIAQQSYYSASLIRVQAEGDRLADAVAFFMAIGG